MDLRADQGRGPACCAAAERRVRERLGARWSNRRIPALLLAPFGGPPSRWSRRRRWAMGLLAAFLLLLATPGAILTWQMRMGGGVALDLLTPWIARSLADQLGDGHRVSIGAAVAARDANGRMEIEARDVVVHDADGRRVASMPRVALGLDGLPILGRPAIRRIDLVGASVALKVGEDGQIALAAGRFRTLLPEDQAPPPGADEAQRRAHPDLTSPLPEPELSPFRRLGIWLDIMEKSGLDGHRLSGIGLRNGTVIVDDARSGKRFIFAGIDFDLGAPASGGLTLGIDASGSGARWTSTAVVTARDREGRRTIDVSMTGLAPRDLSLALQGPQVFFADTPISGTLRAVLDTEGNPADLTGRVSLGAGQVGDLNDTALRVGIDKVSADVRWQSGGPGLVVERVEIAAGVNRAEMTGVVTPPSKPGEPMVVQVSSLTAVTSVLNPHEPPVPVNVRDARFVYDPAPRLLTIERLTIDQGSDPLVWLRGQATFGTGTPAVSLELTSAKMPLATALSLWPRLAAPDVRDWVADNMRGGVAEDTSVRIALPAGALAQHPLILPKDALSVRSRLRGTALKIIPGLSPLTGADVDVMVDGETVQLQVMRGVIEPEPGKRLVLSQGLFEVPDHRPQRPRSVSRFRLQGSADAAFALLGQEAFKGSATGPTLPSGKVEGQVTANVTVSVPLSDHIDRGQIDYSVEADFTGFTADNAFGEMRIERGAFKVQTTPRTFTIRGQGVLGGAQANFEYRKPRPDAKPEIRLTATLDDRGRARLGLNIGPRIAGPTPVKVSTVGDSSGRYTVEVDLGQAALADLLPGWNKPRGQAARARFVAVETDGGWKLEDLVVESRGVLVRGSATFDDKGALIGGVFPAYNLSDGDRMNIRVERAGSGHRITARGEMVDARAILKSFTEPARGSGGSGGGTALSGEYEIDFKAAAMAGGNGEVIRQFEMRMVRRGAEIRALTASGRVGRNAPFAIEQRGQGPAARLAVSAGDAGALLRFLDLYRSLQGGELALVMAPIGADGAIRQGSVEIVNFGIRGDQAISGMVAAAGEPPGNQRRPQAAAPSDAFAFSRMRANFSRTDGKLTIADGLLWGAAIGATVEGEFDPTRDRLSLRGTYVPAYALNNIFARIPVLGLFLGGSPDEGVFGITYQITGAVSAPRLMINPLSAVTPGFLRKMFEFRNRNDRPMPLGDTAGTQR